jgi:hypothetical protein
MRKVMIIVIKVISTGTAGMAMSRGWGASRIPLFVATYTTTEMIPASSGEMTHEAMSDPMPEKDQSTQSLPTALMVMPTTAPTTACVADTSKHEGAR